jgi:hypothetical protein
MTTNIDASTSPNNTVNAHLGVDMASLSNGDDRRLALYHGVARWLSALCLPGALIALAGCGDGGVAVSQSAPPESVNTVAVQSQETTTNSAVQPPLALDETQIPTPPIYVARADLPHNGNLVMTAIWEGQFLVDRGCLIFRGASIDYLPVFSKSVVVTVGRESFTVAGVTHKLGERVAKRGGTESIRARSLAEPIPASCPKEFLR